MTTYNLKDGLESSQVRATDLVSDAISGGTLAVASSEIAAAELASDSVTTDKIADNNVTNLKVGSGAVAYAQLSKQYAAGGVTVGSSGTSVYAPFGVELGSPTSITMTPFDSPAAIIWRVDAYTGSGFDANGLAGDYLWIAMEE